MPYSAPHPCGYPGCRELVRDGARCPAHTKPSPKRTPHNPLYSTTRWQRLRAVVLRRSPVCTECGRPATLVDHIVPISEGGEQFDEANLRPLCAGCHARQPGHGFRRKESPCPA